MTSRNGSFHSPTKLTDQINRLISRLRPLDLVEAPPVEPALLAPFWAAGDFVNLSGPPGCGKTLLAADVVLAALHPARAGRALSGLLRFDFARLDGGKVAILDAENSPVRWSSLLRRKLLAENLDPFEIKWAPLYVRPADVGLQVTGNWERASVAFASALASVRVRVLIVDTLGRTWAPDDINSTSWVQRGLAPFRAACQEHGISAVLLSHTRRRRGMDDPEPTGPIGSSFQEGQVDGQIILNRSQGGHGLTLTLQKSRRAFWIQQGSKVTLRFQSGLSYAPDAGWEQIWPHECPDYDEQGDDVEPVTSAKLTALLRSEPTREWTTAEVANVLDRRERTVRHHMQALVRTGYARRIGNGPTTRWGAVP